MTYRRRLCVFSPSTSSAFRLPFDMPLTVGSVGVFLMRRLFLSAKVMPPIVFLRMHILLLTINPAFSFEPTEAHPTKTPKNAAEMLPSISQPA